MHSSGRQSMQSSLTDGWSGERSFSVARNDQQLWSNRQLQSDDTNVGALEGQTYRSKIKKIIAADN